MKKIITVILILILAFALVACGNSNNDEPSEDNPPSKTKTLEMFNEYISGGSYTMTTKLEVEGLETIQVSAVKDGMIYSESEVMGIKSIMIIKDDVQYLLDPESKTCMKMSVITDDATEIFAEEAANYETAVNTGSETINGKSYDYEEFEVEGIAAKYYYDGDDLKYMTSSIEGEVYMIEVVSFEKGAAAELFEIPEDYMVMEY